MKKTRGSVKQFFVILVLNLRRSFSKTFFPFLIACVLSSPASATEWFPYLVEVWDPPFSMESSRKQVNYVALSKASKKWSICVSFPHMKDAYWLSVNYGIADEAKRLGVEMQLVEAGGYTKLNTQISQIEDCVAAGADAVVIGAISYDGLNNLVSEIRKQGIPVIDIINDMSSTELSAKSLVSFRDMGAKAGEFVAKRHPADAEPVKVAWFPGPSGAGWVATGHAGFITAIKNSAINLVETKYGDTDKAVQLKLVEDTLEAHPDLDYIIGTAVTAEVAVSVLHERGLSDQIKIVSYYYTPGVHEGIRNGRILAAPTDQTVIQGRVAIDQTVRILENKSFEKHVGPRLFIVSQKNFKNFDSTTTLAPDGFMPMFRVE